MNNKLSTIIGQRINTLLAENNVKQKELATFLAIPDNTVSYFVSGRRMPNTEQIRKIAVFFDVPTDYLLGLTNAETTDKDIRFVCDYTGLDEKSIENIKDNLFIPHDKVTEKSDIAFIFINEYIEICRETLNKFLQSEHFVTLIYDYSYEKLMHYVLEAVIKQDIKTFEDISKIVDINLLSETAQLAEIKAGLTTTAEQILAITKETDIDLTKIINAINIKRLCEAYSFQAIRELLHSYKKMHEFNLLDIQDNAVAFTKEWSDLEHYVEDNSEIIKQKFQDFSSLFHYKIKDGEQNGNNSET